MGIVSITGIENGEAKQVTVRADDKEFTARQGSGGLDILVNNIGGGDYGTILDATEEFYDQTMNNNVRGAFFLTKAEDLAQRFHDLRIGQQAFDLRAFQTRDHAGEE